MNTSERNSLALPILAAVLFIPLMAWRRFGPLDFWSWMSVDTALLVGLSFWLDKSYFSVLRADLRQDRFRKVLTGIVSAIMLYIFFWLGNIIARIMMPFAARNIGDVYALRQGASLIRISVLVSLLIGPGEELFWRGFVQRHWQDRLGVPFGWLLASGFYALVHIGSGNIMLVLAALVCGLFWGGLYARFRSLALVIVSHVLWDLLVFILFPFS